MEEIKEILEGIIWEVFKEELPVEVSLAPELEEEESGFRADIATNVAMKLTGVLKKKDKSFVQNPREVAERIREVFLEKIEGDEVFFGTEVQVAGPGFLNIKLSDKFFREKISRLNNNFEQEVKNEDYKGKVVVTEFSDPNPFKVLHIGHLYTSVVGESISRLIEYAGGEVHRVNFGGDVGLHVAKTVYILRNRNNYSIEGIAECYVEGTRAYEEDEEAKAEIVRLNKEIYRINQLGEGNYEGLSEEEKKIAEVYWKGRELSYKYFEQFYEKIGVKFEKFYPESSVAGRGLKEVKAHIPEVYRESEGAIVFSGEEFGLHTRVFVNKEGLPTYEAKDVGLLVTKADDYNFDESVVITGNDIVEYMKVVLKSVEQFRPELVERTRHLTHGNVRLPGNEKMSSRKGNFIKASDVLRDVEARLRSAGSASNWHIIAMAAIKYSFLKYRIGGDIEFDVEESVKMTGNSGPYLLYSSVRARKISSNSGLAITANDSLSEPAFLNNFEVRLSKKFMQYEEVLSEAVSCFAPHLVANYLFELAQEFSRFYENCKVVGDEREAERLEIVSVFYRIMEHGLRILGIEIPEEM